jgi:hypothetical protein
MPNQHTMQEGASQEEGIVVPLELAGLRILKQEVQTRCAIAGVSR